MTDADSFARGAEAALTALFESYQHGYSFGRVVERVRGELDGLKVPGLYDRLQCAGGLTVNNLIFDAYERENDVTGESQLVRHDISGEVWREYDFAGRLYRIHDPKWLYLRPGGTTHRVVDKEGVVHTLPAPGKEGCVLRWKSADPDKPVAF